jgi:hypothetical protein
MPRYSDKRRRRPVRSRESALDWFAEDPWAEPEAASWEDDDGDDWYPGLYDPSDDVDAATWGAEEADEDWKDDPYDGWGPVRPRRKRSHHAR